MAIITTATPPPIPPAIAPTGNLLELFSPVVVDDAVDDAVKLGDIEIVVGDAVANAPIPVKTTCGVG